MRPTSRCSRPSLSFRSLQPLPPCTQIRMGRCLVYTQGMASPQLKEDLPFQHYTLKHRLVAWISMHLFHTATYTVRHGLLKGMKRKGGLGWIPALFSPGIMTAEQQFWSGLDLS